MDRRECIQRIGAAGYALGAMAVRRTARAAAPSDRVVVAHIGVGGMGNTHVNWFAAFSDVHIAALCDVDERHLRRTREALAGKRPNTRIDIYGDFRKVLERDDIDAVTIATPDHWHALIAVHAFKAGKDVYAEKPLSYSIPESRAMLDAQRAARAVFQLGTQIHAGENYHRVVELVRSGVLGDIHTVRVWKSGGAPMIQPADDGAPPQELDHDLWLGPRPARPYNPARTHYNFRYFWDYSGGDYADFWCHISDIAFWALDPGAPKTVHARGKLNDRGMAETHAWIDVDFEFDGLKYFWTTAAPDVPGAKGRGIGACFQGTKGHLVTDYGSRALFLDGKEVPGGDLADVPRSIPRSPGHQRNFLDSVRSRKPTQSDLAYAHTMSIPMHLGLISFFEGRKLAWNGRTERFVDDPAADARLVKTFRAPWTLPSA